MGISSKLLLDAAGTQGSELDSISSLSDRGRSGKKTHLQGVFEGKKGGKGVFPDPESQRSNSGFRRSSRFHESGLDFWIALS